MTQPTNIHTALAKAQSEMGKAVKDSSNPHFKSKYADLASVMGACMPALTANGICVTHRIEETEISRVMITTFTHGASETSEAISIPLILGKQDMQGLGSAMTYARRYGVMALAGIAPEDDDGNATVASAPSKVSQGLKDAWKQGVLDQLPDGATDRQKAEAFAAAIIDEFSSKKERDLQNAWENRKTIIAALEGKHSDLHNAVADAYENRMIER